MARSGAWKDERKANRRGAARLAAVQALYQMDIAGTGLSPGYWRDGEKTAGAFLADPRPGHEGDRVYRTGDLGRVREDGLFEFLGRVDSQIKSRGYRIELGEIEAALNDVAELRESAVVAVDTGGFEATAICCAFAALNGTNVTPVDLRRRLSRLLPPYMLPAHWAAFDVLPKNVNGKVDRPALRDHFHAEIVEQQAGLRRRSPH